MTVSDNEPLIKDKTVIDEYRILKLELWTYMEGLTRGSWNAKDKFRNFFRHLEDMMFGKDISISKISKL